MGSFFIGRQVLERSFPKPAEILFSAPHSPIFKPKFDQIFLPYFPETP